MWGKTRLGKTQVGRNQVEGEGSRSVGGGTWQHRLRAHTRNVLDAVARQGLLYGRVRLGVDGAAVEAAQQDGLAAQEEGRRRWGRATKWGQASKHHSTTFIMVESLAWCVQPC